MFRPLADRTVNETKFVHRRRTKEGTVYSDLPRSSQKWPFTSSRRCLWHFSWDEDQRQFLALTLPAYQHSDSNAHQTPAAPFRRYSFTLLKHQEPVTMLPQQVPALCSHQDAGFDFRKQTITASPKRPELTTQSRIQCVLSLGVKWPGRDASHSFPCFKNEWDCTSIP